MQLKTRSPICSSKRLICRFVTCSPLFLSVLLSIAVLKACFAILSASASRMLPWISSPLIVIEEYEAPAPRFLMPVYSCGTSEESYCLLFLLAEKAVLGACWDANYGKSLVFQYARKREVDAFQPKRSFDFWDMDPATKSECRGIFGRAALEAPA